MIAARWRSVRAINPMMPRRWQDPTTAHAGHRRGGCQPTLHAGRIDPRPIPAAWWIIDRTIPAASWIIDRPIPAAWWITDRPIPAAWWIIDRPYPAS